MNKDLPKTYNSWIGKKWCEEYLKEENVENTPWRDQSSENSLSFKNCDVIKDVFGVKKIQEKLDSRITTLHSSALLAYLFFQGVNKDNPITIPLGEEKVEFDKVFFEHPNKVFDDRRPSQIDVALVSKNNEVVLYLESKFTEYLSGIRSNRFSEKYGKMLEKVFGEAKDGKPYIKNDDEYQITGYTYGNGIKQMLAHFIGVCKGCAKDACEVVKKAVADGAQIYLGTILYKFEGRKFANYEDAIKDVANSMNIVLDEYSIKDGKDCDYKETNPEEILTHAPKNFRVLTEVFTYQDLIKANPNLVNDKIKDFYSFK